MLFIHTLTFVVFKNRRGVCFFLLFLCLYLLLLSALAGIMLSLRLDPWSWPGMTVSRALVVFSGWLLVFRQKNIRTKEGIKEINIHSNVFDVYSNSSMLAPVVLCLRLFCCIRTEGYFFCILLRILCYALQSFLL